MRSAVDTNVISALWSGEPAAARMSELLSCSRAVGGLVICVAVYAELLAHPQATPKFVDKFLSDTGVSVEFDTDESIWRAAAVTFAACAGRRRRSHGAQPKRLLVDFVIGAHALQRADCLLRLDPRRYSTDFPLLTVVQ